MRSLHLYTGLFLVPWMLVYGTSALVLNHHEGFGQWFHIAPPQWKTVREVKFTPDETFPRRPQQQARAILEYLDLDGPHRIQGEPNPRQMVVMRICGTGNYRVTWRRRQSLLIVARQKPFSTFRLIHFLHFRAGYNQPYVDTIAWAAVVDTVAVSMWLWAISGVYLWARRPRRLLGGLCFAAGMVIFAVLVVLLCR